MRFTIYTDGSCPQPQGPGGYASICIEDESLTAAGFELETTNNRMEMRALFEGLNALPDGCVVTVVSDSQLLIGGCTKWRANWEKNWPPARVKNTDYWERIYEAMARHRSVAFIYVKGHNGDEHNERADKLAGEQTLLAKEQAS